MRKNKKNVLEFPKPPAPFEPQPGVIVCQIGNERFAIHYQIEDLPPANQRILLQPRKEPEPAGGCDHSGSRERS